uniref:Uncharacterized protein n=1 Tax=Sus scrofa TaxID=9823 RepID=A0A8D1MVF0_PIG
LMEPLPFCLSVSGDDCFELESSMAESRLRAPDLGAQLGVARCQGKCQKSSPDARRQPLSGKSFYLDLPAGKNLQFLTGAIQQLGGVCSLIFSSPQKETCYLLSVRPLFPQALTSRRPGSPCGHICVCAGALHSSPHCSLFRQVPLSRGKELLQKAIRNQPAPSWSDLGESHVPA